MILCRDKNGKKVEIEPTVEVAKEFARWLAVYYKKPRKHYVDAAKKRWSNR